MRYGASTIVNGVQTDIMTDATTVEKAIFRTQEEININSSLISMFSSIDNVETNLDKCCVCHEKTGVLTSCNHHICIPCADKVLSITQEEYDDDYNVRKCPMCRQGNITEMPITFYE